MTIGSGGAAALLGRASRALEGGAFALFTSALLACTVVASGLLMLVPPSQSAAGRFAQDFKVWCFGYDPLTGNMEPALVGSMLLGPVPLLLLILGIWGRPLAALFRQGIGSWAPPLAAAIALVLGAAGLLAAGARESGTDVAEFPAVDLRTQAEAPQFSLVDHAGRPVSLADLRGKVVVVTAVFSRCSTKCPLMLAQLQRIVDALSPEERRDLHVVAITLDPEFDTPSVLAGLARGHGLDDATWSLCTGEPSRIGELLDRLGFDRTGNAATGILDHATLFLLVDRQGRLAYRFGLGELQEAWTLEGLRVLLREAPVQAMQGPLTSEPG